MQCIITPRDDFHNIQASAESDMKEELPSARQYDYGGGYGYGDEYGSGNEDGSGGSSNNFLDDASDIASIAGFLLDLRR